MKDQEPIREQDDIFIDRMIDVLRDHLDPLSPTPAETGAGDSIWSLTTPRDYLALLLGTYDKDAEHELRQRVSHAIQAQEIDRVLFLTLVLTRLPQFTLTDDERMPWCMPRHMS